MRTSPCRCYARRFPDRHAILPADHRTAAAHPTPRNHPCAPDTAMPPPAPRIIDRHVALCRRPQTACHRPVTHFPCREHPSTNSTASSRAGQAYAPPSPHCGRITPSLIDTPITQACQGTAQITDIMPLQAIAIINPLGIAPLGNDFTS